MKFTVLSHAGLAVEHGGVQLVFDPWLIGSCYWRSWWNFPEPPAQLLAGLRPNYIYLTHLHWDHFHGPSLKKLFSPNTTIIVPKVPTRRMLADLAWLGFHNVVEVPHGGRIRLGNDFELRSYQFGIGVDSAAVVSGGGYSLFNCNDCKFFGLPLRQILSDFPNLDFIFRSHSSASPVPLCIENHDKMFSSNDANYDSAEQFARCALHTRARYAIPFASNHCFLHPETRHFNATITPPELAQRAYAALRAQVGAVGECVVMPPGSEWNDSEGFSVSHFDFDRRDDYVEGLLAKNAARLDAQLELEQGVKPNFTAFRAYFEKFLRALPWFVRRFKLADVTFRVRHAGGLVHWHVDPKAARIAEIEHASTQGVVFEVHAAVVNDCASNRMFSVWTASKRLKIHLPSEAALASANLWFTVLDMYETDLLPLRKNFALRSLAVRIRRWREPAELAAILVRRLFLKRRFSVSGIYPLSRPDT